MTSAERVELIDRYKQGYAEVTTALAGIAPEELDWKPAKSEWSAREVVHHLADSEMIAAVRLRRMLIADDAQLWRYDPDELAVRFTYAERPLEAAMALFQTVRAYTAELLDRMTEADWAKRACRRRPANTRRHAGCSPTGRTPTSTPSRSGTTETPSGANERALSQKVTRRHTRSWSAATLPFAETMSDSRSNSCCPSPKPHPTRLRGCSRDRPKERRESLEGRKEGSLQLGSGNRWSGTASVANWWCWLRPRAGRSDDAGHRLRESG